MKSLLIFLFTSVCIVNAFAQGEVKYVLTVRNPRNNPVPNLSVEAVEKSSLNRVKAQTNAQGMVTLNLKGGKEWAISIGELKECLFAEVKPKVVFNMNKTYVYNPADYKRRLLQRPDRTNGGYKIIEQTHQQMPQPQKGQSILVITIKQPDGQPLNGVKVEVVNVKESLVYATRTGKSGLGYFALPNDANYDIDVDGIRNMNYADFGREQIVRNLVQYYEPTVVKEKTVHDTTYQEATSATKPSTERALLRLTVSGGKKNGAKEPVFLHDINSGRVFTTETNEKRDAWFLLPLGTVYTVDFLHQKDVDAISFKYASGFYTSHVKLNYVPDPRLEYPETFIPTPDRLIQKSFQQFLTKQFAKPKDKPFNLVIRSIKKINRNSREALFMLTLAGAEEYGNVRLPLNAALVLDKSGSMYSDGRAEALKNAVLAIGETLNDQDKISIVLFDDEARAVDKSDTESKTLLKLVAENYTPGGSTNILDGLQKGAEQLAPGFDRNKSNKIILLTDGYGDNEPREITNFVEARYREGIEFSAIGLGQDYNQSLLELIALKGNGTFNYVDSSSALSDAFMSELKHSSRYAARDLKVELYQNEKLLFSNLYGYPVKSQTEKSVTIEVGKVPFGRNEIAFVKYKLNKPSAQIEASPLKVVISYFDLYKNKDVREEQLVRLGWTDESDTELLIDEEEKTMYAIAILNQSLKHMAESHAAKDDMSARKALEDGKKQIEEVFPGAKPKDVNALFEDVNRYIKLFLQIEKNKQ